MKTLPFYQIRTRAEFEQCSLHAFSYQYTHNSVYKAFCDHLGVDPEKVKTIEAIPFLPISFFKEHKILASPRPVETTFTSSGTTGTTTSKHYVTDISLYEESFIRAFEMKYGALEEYTILALLPAYLERTGSSLIYMVDNFINRSKSTESGFYLNNLDDLATTLKQVDSEGRKILLIGVSFALLDLIETYSFNLANTIVMETGGMKGRRREMIREELHGILQEGFGVAQIHSEYGMTELLSQAYSSGNGIFETPPWMSLLIRDTEDALNYVAKGKTGGINVIDLANINSCPFIATQDLGREIENNRFEILGRFDESDIRGCNLMVL